MMQAKAFTLIEVIVVVIVIGILAAVVVPRFASAQANSTIAATSEDLHAIEKSLNMYYASNGTYPAEVAQGVFPAGLEAFMKTGNPFAKIAPIGGKYDYEGIPTWSPVQISIHSVAGGDEHSAGDALALDEYMDDGDLLTGNLRRDGTRTYYIIGTN